MELFYALLIGALAGWLAGVLTKGQGFGLLGNIIVGVLGALLGSQLFGWLGISAGGTLGKLIMSVIGALVLLYLISLIRKKP